MIIELLGASLENSAEDGVMPEGYVLDCLKRNSRLDMLKDAEYVVWALEHCGILMHVSDETLKFVYHENKYGLNLCRSDLSDWDLTVIDPVPCSSDLIPFLVYKLATVRDVHSVDFLEYVDASCYLTFIDFDDDLICGEIMEDVEKKCVARKMLVDLLYLLRTHISLLGVVELDEVKKFHYSFKNKKITVILLENLLGELASSDPHEQVSLYSVSVLRWTLSGKPEADTAILRKALEEVVNDKNLVRTENNTLIAPRYFSLLDKSDLQKLCAPFMHLQFYDFHLVPY